MKPVSQAANDLFELRTNSKKFVEEVRRQRNEAIAEGKRLERNRCRRIAEQHVKLITGDER